MKKLDIMRMRKGENWDIVGGKVQRIEGPVVENSISEIKEVAKVELKEEFKKSKKKKKLKKKLK